MQEVFAVIRKVATTDISVLIAGETGTGKELVARALHRLSTRRDGPFVVINCGAIPGALLESELFGHEKGAFTGAHVQRKGRIELASGGTLLLDEVGELSPPLQVKLLRFLEERRIERVGGRELINVDARVLAATNLDLKEAIKDGRFREDLYYRLGVVNMELPPLRERDGDILLLSNVLIQRYVAESKKRIVGFDRRAINAIRTYDWPGNVRELENRVKRAVIMAGGLRLTASDLELAPSYVRNGGLKEARKALEIDLVQKSLAGNKGNITQAARDLGISRPSLYELMEKLGIRSERRGGNRP